ncbi:MAG: sigma-70 family RNA polymerase sigma factor [Acidimicrobiales bacterium]
MIATDDAAQRDDELLRRFALTRDRDTRALLVERHASLAAHIARRFERRELADDLRQAAMIGLLKALDRFDPDRGSAFAAFASVTIEGELKRFLRDQTWAVRVPRTAKELHLVVERATDELTISLGRAPTVDEIARHTALDRDEVVRGVAAGAARRSVSLDAPLATNGGRPRDLAGADTGREFDAMADREHAQQLLALLPDRERRIVELRVYDELSQREIAELMGMSQMHVSRLLRRSFETMRAVQHRFDEDRPSTSDDQRRERGVTG